MLEHLGRRHKPGSLHPAAAAAKNYDINSDGAPSPRLKAQSEPCGRVYFGDVGGSRKYPNPIQFIRILHKTSPVSGALQCTGDMLCITCPQFKDMHVLQCIQEFKCGFPLSLVPILQSCTSSWSLPKPSPMLRITSN